MVRDCNYLGLVNALDAIQKKYGKGYCYPSQNRLLYLLIKYHDEFLSLRTLNRRLAYLEAQGYVVRRRRIMRLDNGLLQFQTTLYVLTRKAYKFIGRFVRKLSHHTKKVSNWLIQKESPSVSIEIPGPDEGRLLSLQEVRALAQGLLKTFS